MTSWVGWGGVESGKKFSRAGELGGWGKKRWIASNEMEFTGPRAGLPD